MIVMTQKLQEIMDELKISNADTYYHSIRVKALVFKMLKWMNKEEKTEYTPEEIDYICKGAILHDVGKLCVKNAVLTKDSGLTQEEMSNMTLHTKLGFELIEDELTQAEYDIIKTICLYHHERLDGGGYEGKRELPVYAQIVSICDVFDALRTERIYRKGFSYEKTMEIIKEGGSGYFNKDIIQYLEKVTSISEK